MKTKLREFLDKLQTRIEVLRTQQQTAELLGYNSEVESIKSTINELVDTKAALDSLLKNN